MTFLYDNYIIQIGGRQDLFHGVKLLFGFFHGQRARDDESQEMLDIIFSNVVYEVAQVNNFGLSTIISGLVQNNSTDVASALDTQRAAVQKAIDDFVAELAKWNY